MKNDLPKQIFVFTIGFLTATIIFLPYFYPKHKASNTSTEYFRRCLDGDISKSYKALAEEATIKYANSVKMIEQCTNKLNAIDIHLNRKKHALSN